MSKLKFFAILLVSLVTFAASAQLPSVKLKTLDGKIVDTATLSNDGKPFVVSFFATWCHPCLRELSAIHEVYPDWQEETGMRLIAIATDDTRSVSRVKPLVDREGWEYEVLLDVNSDLATMLGIEEIPHLLIFDGNGRIVESHSGYNDGSEAFIIEKIKELLAKQSNN